MDDTELAAAVAEAARLPRDSARGATAMFALAKQLSEARPEFAGRVRTVLGGRSAHALDVTFTAQIMLRIVRYGGTPDSAVAWMKKALATTSAKGGAVKALYGVTCMESIAMSNDVVLMPFAQLPQSEIKDWILSDHERANEAQLLQHGFRAPPFTALFRKGTIDPLFSPSPSYDWTKAPQFQWFDDLDTATLLLALTPEAVPTETAHWFHFDDPDVDVFGHRGLSRHYDDIQPASAWANTMPTMITGKAVAGTFSLFRKLKSNEKEHMTLALQRLVRSRPQLIVNRAIDLAIALEVLFMNRDSGGEHSYKIGMRLAKLLYTDPSERSMAFLETRRLYDLRSNVVHTGRSKDDWSVGSEKRTAFELVQAGDLRCTQVIRKLLERGVMPAQDEWSSIEMS